MSGLKAQIKFSDEIHTRRRCDLGVEAWTSPPRDSSDGLVGNWTSHWDKCVCWCSGIFINSLCFSVPLISWGRGVRGRNRWLHGWIIYLLGVGGHSMAVRVGISWYSQRWRDLCLYILDLLTCFIIHVWCSEWVVSELSTERRTLSELLSIMDDVSHPPHTVLVGSARDSRPTSVLNADLTAVIGRLVRVSQWPDRKREETEKSKVIICYKATEIHL